MFTKQDAEKILTKNNQEHILKDFDSLDDSKEIRLTQHDGFMAFFRIEIAN